MADIERIVYCRGNTAKQWIFTDLAKRVAGMKSFRILDLACGDGHLWRPFLGVHTTVTVCGLDADVRAIARGQVTGDEMGRLCLQRADAQYVMVEEYDAVTALSALEHVVDLTAFVDTVWRALGSGGIAYLNYDAGHFRTPTWQERVMVPVSQILAQFGVESWFMREVDDRVLENIVLKRGFRIKHWHHNNLWGLKRLMREATLPMVEAWIDFEECLNLQVDRERLHALMGSTTLVIEKP